MRKRVALFVIKSLDFVERIREVIHHQIQVNLVGIFFLGEEIMMDFYAIWVFKLLNNDKLSIGIFWVLVNSFYGDFLFVGLSLCFVDDPECSLSDDLNPFISF